MLMGEIPQNVVWVFALMEAGLSKCEPVQLLKSATYLSLVSGVLEALGHPRQVAMGHKARGTSSITSVLPMLCCGPFLPLGFFRAAHNNIILTSGIAIWELKLLLPC